MKGNDCESKKVHVLTSSRKAIKTSLRDAGPHSESRLHHAQAESPPPLQQTSKDTKKSETLHRERRRGPELTPGELSRQETAGPKRPGSLLEPGRHAVPAQSAPLPAESPREPRPGPRAQGGPGPPRLDVRGPTAWAAASGRGLPDARLRAQRGLALGPSPAAPGGREGAAPGPATVTGPRRAQRPPRPPLPTRSPSSGPGSQSGAPAASPQLGAPTPPPSLSLARPPRRNWARVASSGRSSALRASPAETEARLAPSGPRRGGGARGAGRGDRAAAGPAPRVGDPVPSAARRPRAPREARLVPARWPRAGHCGAFWPLVCGAKAWKTSPVSTVVKPE